MRALIVEPAKASDLVEISELVGTAPWLDSDRAEAVASGPAAAGYHSKSSDFRAAMDRGERAFVCRRGEKVVGFLHATPLESTQDDALRRAVAALELELAYVVLSIVVAEDQRQQGVATLLHDTFQEAVRPLPIVSSVPEHPESLGCIRLNRSQGMTVKSRFEGSDGRTRLLFVHPGTLRKEVIGLRDLIEQYRVASSLYVHESQTNWTKVNNHFYVTAGLLAVGGLILPQFADGVAAASTGAQIALAGLLSLGIANSTIFSISLRAGIFYVHARKDAVMRLESRIVSLGGSPVVSPRSLPAASHVLRRSPSTKVMPLLPMIVGLAWTLAAIAFVGTLVNGRFFSAP